MSEFSIPSTTCNKNIELSTTLLLSDLFLFFSFILSHPVYFFYFIFFFPYIYKLFSFLSPLFITTFLLLLVFLTFSPDLVTSDHLSESKVSLLFGTYQAIVERLRSYKVEEDENAEVFDRFEELEAYKIVFDTSSSDIGDDPVQFLDSQGNENSLTSDDQTEEIKKCLSNNESGNEDLEVIKKQESCQLITEVKTLGVFLDEKEEEFEQFASQKDKKEAKSLSSNFNKVEEKKEELYIRSGSKAMAYKLKDSKGDDGTGSEYFSRMSSLKSVSTWSSPDTASSELSPRVFDYSPSTGSNLSSFGSMRKEKEWRRTLACKLFEERNNNVEGGEGMDMLWETYETDSVKAQKSKKGKKGNVEHDEDDDDEEDELNNGQLCCLQALKFSAGKMNLGMGKPNLVKFSKALKGIGWLHHVTKNKKNYH